jgi:hypothetical protein
VSPPNEANLSALRGLTVAQALGATEQSSVETRRTIAAMATADMSA